VPIERCQEEKSIYFLAFSILQPISGRTASALFAGVRGISMPSCGVLCVSKFHRRAPQNGDGRSASAKALIRAQAEVLRQEFFNELENRFTRNTQIGILLVKRFSCGTQATTPTTNFYTCR
jgi:hypothetical protein